MSAKPVGTTVQSKADEPVVVESGWADDDDNLSDLMSAQEDVVPQEQEPAQEDRADQEGWNQEDDDGLESPLLLSEESWGGQAQVEIPSTPTKPPTAQEPRGDHSGTTRLMIDMRRKITDGTFTQNLQDAFTTTAAVNCKDLEKFLCFFLFQCLDQRSKQGLGLIVEEPLRCYQASKTLTEHLYSL